MARMRRGQIAYERAKSGDEARLQSGMAGQSLGSSIGGGLGTLGMGLNLASLTNPVGWGIAAAAMGGASLIGSMGGRGVAAAAGKKIGSGYKFSSREADEAKSQIFGQQLTSAATAAAAGGVSAKADLTKLGKLDDVGMWGRGDFLAKGTGKQFVKGMIPGKPSSFRHSTIDPGQTSKTSPHSQSFQYNKEYDPSIAGGFVTGTSTVDPTVTGNVRTGSGRIADLFRTRDDMKLFKSTGTNIAGQQQSAWDQLWRGTKLME